MQLSLVIPLCNEEESLEQLHREICDVADDNKYDLEIIFVDDGSTDQSWAIVEKIAGNDPRVRGIQFRRNFGKAAALQAGFNAAQGDFVMTLDADLQDDPKEIPGFLQQMETGLDVVSGWKQRRHDPKHKVFASRVFNGIVSFMTGVKLHDHNCGMKCYRREVVKSVALYGEWHRFVPVFAAAQGYKVGEKVVAHRSRQFGRSKYGFNRTIKFFMDPLTAWFLTRYSQRPQHFFGTLGLILLAIGIIGHCCRIAVALLDFGWGLLFMGMHGLSIGTVMGTHLARFPFLPSYGCLLLLFAGMLFIALGLLAELFVAKTLQADTCYSVKKELGDRR